MRAYTGAITFVMYVEKLPRTAWRGMPLHELWLADPDAKLVEINVRLTDYELGSKPAEEAPAFPGRGLYSAF